MATAFGEFEGAKEHYDKDQRTLQKTGVSDPGTCEAISEVNSAPGLQFAFHVGQELLLCRRHRRDMGL